MNIFIIVFLLIFLLGICLFIFIKRKQKVFGVLNGENIYQDSVRSPGEILYANGIPLCGKPDYILKDKGNYLPVEVKTGRTPSSAPYPNHVMQLMAYCYLVEEKYGVIVPGGVIKYPEKEFRVQYTDEACESVRKAVKDIITARVSGEEFNCPHAAHN